jgi:5,6,7,8-tetrahydromethanopterin hydro-lyase
VAGPRPVLIGESFVGEGAAAAHINTVLGDRHGPVGTAWATSLANGAAGTPEVADMPAVRHAPHNPFFTPA